ncbi:hypothetical protein SDC9_134615 [bioreactor metagenome]|uniref:Uncharacterized protein n=1 Tax=bioreactor metagenome TaxID=1076179 RepID=A0A645DER0_9ZZZZ
MQVFKLDLFGVEDGRRAQGFVAEHRTRLGTAKVENLDADVARVAPLAEQLGDAGLCVGCRAGLQRVADAFDLQRGGLLKARHALRLLGVEGGTLEARDAAPQRHEHEQRQDGLPCQAGKRGQGRTSHVGSCATAGGCDRISLRARAVGHSRGSGR